MYHGTADGVVPTKGSTLYYDRVTAAMGDPHDFFRLFLYVSSRRDSSHSSTTISRALLLPNETKTTLSLSLGCVTCRNADFRSVPGMQHCWATEEVRHPKPRHSC